MSEPALLALQQTLAGLILEPEEAAFTADPEGFAARFGLPALDQAAFLRFQDRLLAYRELARMGLQEPVEDMFPVLRAHLEGAGTWDDCLNQFLEARCLTSPHYRDIAPTFLGWLADTRWGQDRWPWLVELAHFEFLETLVSRFPETPADPGLDLEPSPEARIVLAPATQVVAYGHAVHQATEAAPVPLPGPVFLLAYRDAEADFHLQALTDALAALLGRGQTVAIAQAAKELGLHDLAEVWPLLADLRAQGAIAGFAAD